jgi:hydroxyethylthiazole kinase-like uncharacterized protein yjeF
MDAGEPLHDIKSVRAIEREAIARGTPGYELMQRAAAAAFAALRRHWPEARRLLVACGRGNNGGDGFLLACLLHEAGMQVRVCAAEVADATSPDARLARAAWERHGSVAALAHVREHQADVAVDALLGVGLSRAPQGELAQAIDDLNALGAPVFALDVPSGLDADFGLAPGAAVRAARTLTFIANKRGLHTAQGREHAGAIECDALDADISWLQKHAPAARLLQAHHLGRFLQPRARHAHKGHHGHVLCLGGERGMGGAMRLCAEGALRAGAGWVSVATRAEHVSPLLAARPEAMTHAVESGDELAPLLQRATVLALGPGLGQGEWGRGLFAAALRSGKPLVIDADALNLLAAGEGPAAAMPLFLPPMADIVGLARHAREDRHPASMDSSRRVFDDPSMSATGGDCDESHSSATAQAVLTPHPGEAARLLGCSVRDIEADRFAAAARLAITFGAAVILKGAGSIVAAPGRTACVIGAGNPGMASAGMGDVLTGVVAALRAQGLAAFEAACAGALLHAAAGDAAARRFGERGLLASDLFDAIPPLANPA